MPQQTTIANAIPANFRKMHGKLKEMFKATEYSLVVELKIDAEEIKLGFFDPKIPTSKTKEYYFPSHLIQLDLEKLKPLWQHVLITDNSMKFTDTRGFTQTVII